jgi:hypothetical protein
VEEQKMVRRDPSLAKARLKMRAAAITAQEKRVKAQLYEREVKAKLRALSPRRKRS